MIYGFKMVFDVIEIRVVGYFFVFWTEYKVRIYKCVLDNKL